MTEPGYLKTCSCGKQFHGAANRRFCDDCHKEKNRINNRVQRIKRQKRMKKEKNVIAEGSGSGNWGRFEVIRHNDPTGFFPGATFLAAEVSDMVVRGYVNGIVLRKCGKNEKVYTVENSSFVEVKG